MKVGDYVRTKDGDIGKIKENDEEIIKYCVGTLYGIGLNRNCLDREVLKSSPNIIDLIEVGDYVNGYRVIDFDYSVADTRIRIWIDTENEINYIFKNDIKSIVTHEQFSQIEYRIGE